MENVSYVVYNPLACGGGFSYRKKNGMAHLSQRYGSRSEAFQRRRDTRKTTQRIVSAMIERLYSPTAAASQAKKDIVLEYRLTA